MAHNLLKPNGRLVFLYPIKIKCTTEIKEKLIIFKKNIC